ncbi:cadherin-like domain-containing protein [Shewanella electrodiphila]|uniref:Cadherin-like domain-containing protein n=1 Tax=Shewanella electrodiphila TaxID=934143 RepID=A0ABT0KPD0_9GAMM|nr:cadherin-like domain-containing protein [Shewanella electrodiphila]MCL1045696.1 cadherin-like domain-containing protein [Shewanella electrodiphila]
MAKHTFPIAPLALAVVSVLLTACGGGSSDSNSAPVFDTSSLAVTLEEDTSFDGNLAATDTDGDQVSFSITQTPENGSLSLSADGSYSYTPEVDFFGTDTATVEASDGTAATSANLVFTVTNVNDAPVIVSSSVAVNANGVTEGQIVATDADEDALSYSIEVAPESGSLALDATTGSFTYTADPLSFAKSFTVGVNDGNSDMVTAVIELKPSYETNQQKQDYYYASELSHLKQSQALIKNLEQDNLADPAYHALAQGYANAGLTDESSRIVNEDIINQDNKARALRDIAADYNDNGLFDEGDVLRDEALKVYNIYVADKGFSSFNTTDGRFYLSLLGDYQDSGNELGAENVLAMLGLIKEALQSDEYTTSYGYLLTSNRNYVEELQTQYLTDKTEDNRLKFVAAVDNFVEYIEDIGYEYLPSSKANAGSSDYYKRAFYYGWALEYYVRAGEEDKSKELIARIISLHGEVTYDEEYNRPANEYAEYTKENGVAYALQLAAGALELLYPNLSPNPALAIVTGSEFLNRYESTVQAEIDDYHGLSIILEGGSVETATDYLIGLSPDAYRTQFRDVAEQTITSPGLAAHLINYGMYDEAKQAIEIAKGILTSAEMIEERLTSPANIVGASGCGKLIELLQRMDAQDEAVALFPTCQQLLTDNYPLDAEDLTTANLLTARQELMSVAGEFGESEVAAAITIEALTLIDKVSDFEDRIEWRYEFSQSAALNGLLISPAEQATTIVDEYLTGYETYVADQDGDEEAGLEIGIEILEQLASPDDYNTSTDAYSVVTQMRYHAAADDYATSLASVQADIARLISFIDTKVQTQTATIQANIYEDWVALLAGARNYDFAKAIIARDSNAEAAQLELTAVLAEEIALQEDFPATAAANVDTDQDGKPNFFISVATEEQITASGLTADDDTDGDGILDSEDVNPLLPDSAQ